MEHERIKKNIEEMLKLMNLSVESVQLVTPAESSHHRFQIFTSDSAILIGQNGENLEALNYLLRRIVLKSSSIAGPAKFTVDVNGYYDKSLENVKAKAKVMLDRARSFKIDIEMEPMSSYERMLVHSYLENEKDIKTESKGEGKTRRVVIKYLR